MEGVGDNGLKCVVAVDHNFANVVFLVLWSLCMIVATINLLSITAKGLGPKMAVYISTCPHLDFYNYVCACFKNQAEK